MAGARETVRQSRTRSSRQAGEGPQAAARPQGDAREAVVVDALWPRREDDPSRSPLCGIRDHGIRGVLQVGSTGTSDPSLVRLARTRRDLG